MRPPRPGDWPVANTVVFTLATSGYVPFVLNLHASLAKLGFGAHLQVGALDDDALRLLSAAGVRCVRMSERECSTWYDFKASGWGRVMAFKYDFALQTLAQGRNVLYCDGDIVFLKDPAAHLRAVVSRESPDLLTQFEADNHRFGAGLWWAAPSSRTIDLFERVRAVLLSGASNSDQTTLNSQLSLVPGLRLSSLDPLAFPCGEDMRRHARLASTAYLLHFNYNRGYDEKIRHIRQQSVLFHPALASHRRERVIARLMRFASPRSTRRAIWFADKLSTYPGRLFSSVARRPVSDDL